MVPMGPLPQLYRLVVAGTVVVLALAGGLWLAGWFALPLGGIGVGLGAGCLLAFVLTHDFGHSVPHDGRPTRAPHRR
jgi:fatty acid desaturase